MFAIKEKFDKSFCLGTQNFWNLKRTNWVTSLIWERLWCKKIERAQMRDFPTCCP